MTYAKINIFDYSDYRDFLREALNEARERIPGFTYAHMLRQAGYKSRATLWQIFKKKDTHISLDKAQKFAEILHLNIEETEYLKDLVEFSTTKSTNKKVDIIKKLTPNQYEYLSKWYYIVIREMLATFQFRGESSDYKKLISLISPTISIKEAKKAIKILAELGLIYKDTSSGIYKINVAHVKSDTFLHLIRQKFIVNMIDIGKDKITLDPSLRKFKSYTFSVTENKVDEINILVNDFFHKLDTILQDKSKDDIPDSVYQINLQFFPFTNRRYTLS